MSNDLLKEIGNVTLRLRTPGGGFKIIALDMFNIDETNLAEEFARQASLYAYFATAAAIASQEASSKKAQTKQSYAQNDLAWRESFQTSSLKATEPQIKSSVESDPEYIQAVAAEIAAQYESEVLEAIVAAMKMRADMLISLGAHLRAEMDQTGMKVREQQYSNAVDSVREKLQKKRVS